VLTDTCTPYQDRSWATAAANQVTVRRDLHTSHEIKMSVVDVGERVQDTLFQLVHDTKLDPLIGLHFRSLTANRRFARRTGSSAPARR
jgi:hypothetical protein